MFFAVEEQIELMLDQRLVDDSDAVKTSAEFSMGSIDCCCWQWVEGSGLRVEAGTSTRLIMPWHHDGMTDKKWCGALESHHRHHQQFP